MMKNLRKEEPEEKGKQLHHVDKDCVTNSPWISPSTSQTSHTPARGGVLHVHVYRSTCLYILRLHIPLHRIGTVCMWMNVYIEEKEEATPSYSERHMDIARLVYEGRQVQVC